MSFLDMLSMEEKLVNWGRCLDHLIKLDVFWGELGLI